MIDPWRRAQLLLARLCYRAGATVLPYPPLLVNLEPTNHCNLRCPMCPVSQSDRRSDVARGFMDPAVLAEVVRKIAPFRPEIALNLGGESLLHPRIVDIVATLKAAGLYVFLDSNATLLTAD